MRLCVFIEPQQGAGYDDQLRVARRAEEAGFDGFFRSDHYLKMGSASGLPGPTDSWATLAGLARETSRIRLGTLVSSATFRLPGPLAISVAQVDAMSGGRVELGLGTGWFEAEHTAYGIPFPPRGERFARLTEQLQIVTGLWTTPVGETFSFGGEHYQLVDSPALPKPVQSPHPPVIVGGTGPRRTPRLAARFADELNVGFSTVEVAGARFAAAARSSQELDRAGAGRAPLVCSMAGPVCCGRTDAEVKRRAEAIGRSVDAVRGAGGFAGTPEQVVEQLAAYRAVGASRAYLQVLDLADLDHLDLLAAEVIPAI
ncbi:MAG: TIGR03560 family F420-dependent LLM class oxidoreductase [Micromonosporaceae bacterium]|nr:TIGR03560 family F420-dependent LLM class oxidoreductase [Micromonosporaceae bacterium]